VLVRMTEMQPRCRLQCRVHSLLTAHHSPPTTNYLLREPLTTNYLLRIWHVPRTTYYVLLATGYWLLATGYWLTCSLCT
jgi:hypothetical protein